MFSRWRSTRGGRPVWGQRIGACQCITERKECWPGDPGQHSVYTYSTGVIFSGPSMEMKNTQSSSLAQPVA